MKIIDNRISRDELRQMAANIFGDMVKAVVDVDKEIVAIDAELHSDLESMLLEGGSKQKSLWGVNLYPDLQGNDFVEFDSLINIRPSQGNRSRDIENIDLRAKILSVIAKKVD